MIHQTMMTNPKDIKAFVKGGKAHFTLRSKKTGTRFTFRVRKAGRRNVWFAAVLTGCDNENHYSYFAYDQSYGFRFDSKNKAKLREDTPSVKAFFWFMKKLLNDEDLSSVEFWHQGKCARCARMLTVPESIAHGFGPECIKYRQFVCDAA